MKVPFTRTALTGRELQYIEHVVAEDLLEGNGPYTKRCEDWIKAFCQAEGVVMTNSGTGALEMAALLAGIGPGDEVIMPSFTFSSTATAFALRGASCVFVDVRADDLNMDPHAVEACITPKTKAIVPMHYSGVACDMAALNPMAREHGLWVIEDAAHGFLARYDNEALGALGDMGIFSFHRTKNIPAGEAGALVLKDADLLRRARIIRDKGTNRDEFKHGLVSKYEWVDIGSSYPPSDLIAAFLWAQLEAAEAHTRARLRYHRRYTQGLQGLADQGHLRFGVCDARRTPNAHLFWFVVQDEGTRQSLLTHLNERGIAASFHYVPLHSSPAGRRYGQTPLPLETTEALAKRLVRLPLSNAMDDQQVDYVIEQVRSFFAT